VLGEGGFGVTADLTRAAARRGIKQVVYLCGERTGCPGMARSKERTWRRSGVRCQTLIMPGAGHEYGEGFDELSRQVFELLLREEP